MVSSKIIRKISRNRTSLPYRIIDYIGKHSDEAICTQIELARRLEVPNTSLNHWITRFKEEGLINDILQLTNVGQRLFLAILKNPKKLRAHNMQVTFDVIRCPDNFVEKYCGMGYEQISNGRFMGFKGELDRFLFMFYSKRKIVCVLKDIFANSEGEISGGLLLECSRIKDALEQKFPEIKIGSRKGLMKIQTMHVSLLNSIVAEGFVKKGLTYESTPLTIDNSKGRAEIEITEPKIFDKISDIQKLGDELMEDSKCKTQE